MTVLAPEMTEVFQDGRRDRHQAFPVTFADDPEPLTDTIDRFDLEIGGLADPEATGIDQLKAAAVNRVSDLGQNAPDHGIRAGKR